MPNALTTLINVKQDIIPSGRPNRPGTKIAVSKITVHNTSNTASGATAKAHSRFVRETGYYTLPSGKKNYVSWHFTVDDAEVYQHLPLDEKGWHAGGGNSRSLGIEICMFSGIDQGAANLRAATLIAGLLVDLGLSPSDVVTHKSWTNKACPTLLLTASKWNAFIGLIEGVYTSFREEHSTLLSEEEIGMVETARANPDASFTDDAEEPDMDHDLVLLE